MTAPRSSRRGRRAPCLAALLLAGACARGDASHVEGVGTLELTDAEVAPLVAARVVALRVEEGDAVAAGDTLAVLEVPGLRSEVASRAASAAAADAAAGDVAAGARAPEIRRLDDERRALAAEADRLARDAERAARLYAAGAVSAQQEEAGRTAATIAAARRDAATEALRLARDGARRGAVLAARRSAEAAQATARGVRATADALVLVAPITGTVLGRHAEPGEVLAPGTPVLTVGDPRRPWTRIYVSQRALPFVRVGAAAEARLDALPDRRFAGRVVAVATEAEFTPRVALTEDERDDLLFGVKIAFDDTTGLLKAGLPVTVRLAGTAASAVARRDAP